MNRTLAMLCAAAVVASGGFAVTEAPAASAPASKDPCLSKPSKFQRDQCEEYNSSAPGDEYFGRMKMSYLGINNTFHDTFVQAGAYTTNSGIIAKVNFADEALRQWENRYPRDPQLARSYFLAIQVMKKIYTKTEQDEAWRFMHELVQKFPSTYFGKIMKADLARGFTEHYFANAQLCPTPLPSGAPVPETTPAATPTPTPKPGQPAVQIITPPCVQPSPVPSPTPVPSNSPAPAAQPSAMALPSPSATPSATATPTHRP